MLVSILSFRLTQFIPILTRSLTKIIVLLFTDICPNIIAMGYPGEYIQSVFRNPMNDVCHFFEVTHPEHYKVYNLRSEKAYDVNKFHGVSSLFRQEAVS